MDRFDIAPRPGWEAIIEEDGLVFWKTDLPDGEQTSYWHEGAYYSLTTSEVYDIEATARVLVNELLIAAGDHIIERNLFAQMGIPGWMVPRIKETWESEPPMLYGRFDFAYGPDQVPKLLEFNADTPTALLETAAIQWRWVEEVFGGRRDGTVDQWNNVHDALIARWEELRTAGRLPGAHVHFLHTSAEDSGEDFMTVAYMVEVAKRSGLKCTVLPIEQLQLNGEVGFVDPQGEPVRTAFKLYPWEWMAHEQFCFPALQRMGAGVGETQWIEPVWKMLWSNKGILPVLWELFPDHPNLLPAYFADDPRAQALIDSGSYVRKPLLAREGANALVVAGGVQEAGPDHGYGEEGYVVQQYTDLGRYGAIGAHPVLGVWIVDMEPQGLGIRESDSLITNNLSRFVPHTIS